MSPFLAKLQTVVEPFNMAAKVKGCQMSAHRLRRVQATTARSGLTSDNP